MGKWLNLFKKTGLDHDDLANNLLRIESDKRRLEIELQEKEARIQNLSAELSKISSRQEELAAEKCAEHMHTLMTAIAPQVAQLVTQDHLIRSGTVIQNRDIMAVANKLIRKLAQSGLTFEGLVGETTLYNPNNHTPLSIEEKLSPGDPVVVRFTGIRYKDILLQKAGVEKYEVK